VTHLSYYDEAGLSAAFYDVVSNAYPFRGDVDFYAGLAGAAGASVLELGCGTGRIVIALAERGYGVFGVDLAPAMLQRAALKCQRLPPEVGGRIALMQGDMTRVALGRLFDAVIVPFYGFAHLATPDARAETLAVIAGHLRPGGRAAIHLPSPDLLRRPLGDEELAGPYNAAGDRVRIRVAERTYDESSGRFLQIMDYTLLDSGGVVTRTTREALVYHAVTHDALVASAAGCGLALSRVLGDFDGAEAGREVIYVFTR
jgi:SAM-dependent methyltransferase